MKRFLSLIMCLSCFVILQKNPVSAMQKPDSYYNTGSFVSHITQNKRACWISYLDIEQYLRDLDENSFRSEISRMYDVMLAYGMNTAIVHVRAFGDAIYPSKIFPLATYISSGRRRMSYDAFAIMVDLAHEKGLQIEAWINPYRLSKDAKTTKQCKQTDFYNTNRSYIVEYTNPAGETALSLDPAKEEARALIVAGIEEILLQYEVDGIHFDDYFYMDGMTGDLSAQDKMRNVNELILSVHQCTEKYKIPFGISPAGNVDYAKSIGADIEKWLSEPGYIDYIMPQLYWSNSYQVNDETVALYNERCMQWKELDTLGLPIYTGLALYRAGETDEQDLGWSLSDTNLKEQWDFAASAGYEGYCLFRYAWLEKEVSSSELENLGLCFEQTEQTKPENTTEPSTPESSTPEPSVVYQDVNEENQILVQLYKTDGTSCILKRACHSFVIEARDVKDITITYLNAPNEDCIAFYRTKCADGTWNRWVSDGNFSNFKQFCTIVEVEIMRIPYKTVKNTCFFVDRCYNNY